jgi:hypothetical protein
MSTTPTTGYAPLNGLQMYYAVHGRIADIDRPLRLGDEEANHGD